MKEIGPKERLLREQREARFARKDPEPKNLSGIAEGRKASVGLSVAIEPKGQARNLDRLDVNPKGGTVAPDTRQQAVGIKADPLGLKRGRPKKGEKRDKPWEALSISKASYYRRQKEKAK